MEAVIGISFKVVTRESGEGQIFGCSAFWRVNRVVGEITTFLNVKKNTILRFNSDKCLFLTSGDFNPPNFLRKDSAIRKQTAHVC